MRSLSLKLRNLLDEEGQTVVEYCIMVGVVGLAIIALNPTITDAVSTFFARVSTSLGQVGT